MCADVAYLDFSKAFDNVSHGKLIAKMLERNLPLSLVKWITNFLTDRVQTITINQQHSKLRKVTSGVPQGSILGPALFLLYTDDIDKIIQGNITLFKFADDIKICHCFDPKNVDSLAHMPLQNCLNALYQWSVDNDLPAVFIYSLQTQRRRTSRFADVSMLLERCIEVYAFFST
jgi:hypothetical protein